MKTNNSQFSTFNFQLLIATIAGFLSCTALKAQHKHELSVYGGGGLSTLKYDVTIGEQKNGFGGQFGLGYQFFFAKNWGLGTGAELGLYNAKFNTDNLNIRYNTTDMDGAVFEFRSRVSNYEEKQQAMLLQIPLMLQFQTGSKHRFYAALGGKAGIPVNGTYKSSEATIQNSGYYAEENYEYTTQEFMGFGTFTGRGANGDLKFKTAFFASAEAGVKWKLSEGLSIYTGAYIDYGLNNMYKNDAPQQFVTYNSQSPRNFAVNSVINSQYTQNGTSQLFTDKITPIAIGIKLKLAFGKGSTTKLSVYVPPVTDHSTIEAQRRAAEEAAHRAEADRIAKEKQTQEAQRLAAEKAQQEETARKQAEAAKMQAIKTNIQQPIENYALSQTELTAMQKQELDEKIALLQQHPDIKFYIYGHTCNIGSADTNERVGLERAEKAKKYIIFKGISESRILGIASKRDTEPLVPNTSEENRRENRRVEMAVQ
jgi:outer membrane protein OmpA-like peptidoglycan-associated protein